MWQNQPEFKQFSQKNIVDVELSALKAYSTDLRNKRDALYAIIEGLNNTSNYSKLRFIYTKLKFIRHAKSYLNHNPRFVLGRALLILIQ